MLNRRELLVGSVAGVAASTLVFVPAVAQASINRMDKTAALGRLESEVRYSLAFAEEVGEYEQEWLRQNYEAFFQGWDENLGDLGNKILAEVEHTYQDPYFAELKGHGLTLFNEEGYMRVTAQNMLFWRIPISLSHGDTELFRAFATFAPADLA